MIYSQIVEKYHLNAVVARIQFANIYSVATVSYCEHFVGIYNQLYKQTIHFYHHVCPHIHKNNATVNQNEH